MICTWWLSLNWQPPNIIMKDKEIEEITDDLCVHNKRTGDMKLTEANMLSSGSTLLNLAVTNTPFGMLPKGKYTMFVGDSGAGKTWLALSCLAEAANSKHFSNYRLIYDDIEGGALMNLRKFFGQKLEKRIEPPAVKDGNSIFSETIQDFYYHVDDAIHVADTEDKPFIYILDSQDALTSAYEKSKFEEHKKAYRDGKDSAGSYGDGKAKVHSEGLRKVLSSLSRTGSILIIINQTRDNLGFGFSKKTRSGGRALRFYASVEIWVSLKREA